MKSVERIQRELCAVGYAAQRQRQRYWVHREEVFNVVLSLAGGVAGTYTVHVIAAHCNSHADLPRYF